MGKNFNVKCLALILLVVILIQLSVIDYDERQLQIALQDVLNKKDTNSDNGLFKLVERSNEAIMKITSLREARTRSMDNRTTAIGKKGLT